MGIVQVRVNAACLPCFAMACLCAIGDTAEMLTPGAQGAKMTGHEERANAHDGGFKLSPDHYPFVTFPTCEWSLLEGVLANDQVQAST